MQRIIVPVLAGVTMALVIYGSALTERAHSPRQNGKPNILGSPPPQGGPNTLQEQHAKAWELLRGGHSREAQDAFLGILDFNPGDQDALQGLVAVRRKMAGDDPGVLRRQSAEYKDAIRRGVDTAEHYTLPAMEALVAASIKAVQEIEALNEATSRPLRSPTEASTPPAGPPPEDKVPSSGKLLAPAIHSVQPAGSQTLLPSGRKLPTSGTRSAKPTGPQKADLTTAPTSKVAEKPPATPARLTPPVPPGSASKTSPPPPGSAPKASPPPAARAAPASPPSAASGATWGLSPRTSPPSAASAPQTSPPPAEPSARIDNRLYMVRVGPLSDRELASAIAQRLLAGGFSQAKIASQAGFRVVSEPLPRSVAEGLVATLAGRGFHSQVEPLSGDAVQLLFGTLTSQKEAETLAQRIGAAGYDAWVHEGVVYTLQLGPYPQSSVNTIAGIIKSGALGATVTADPVSR